MTRDEFLDYYLGQPRPRPADATPDGYVMRGPGGEVMRTYRALPCACRAPDCQGWVMVNDRHAELQARVVEAGQPGGQTLGLHRRPKAP